MFNPTEIGEVELAVKEWLPKDGSISIEGTKKIIDYLSRKDEIYTRYALSVLGDFYNSFGGSESIAFFGIWAMNYVGIDDVRKSFTLSEKTEEFLSKLEPQPGSVLEALFKYTKIKNIRFTQLLAELIGFRSATRNFNELAHIIVPKTDDGISVLAEEFNLEEDVLNKVFAATRKKGFG